MSISQYIRYSLTTRKGSTEFLVALAWASPLLTYVKAIALRLPFVDVFGVWIVPFFYIMLFIMAAPYITKSFRSTDLFITFLLVALYLFQILFFPDNDKLITEYLIQLIIVIIPMYFIGTATDINDVFKPLYMMSILCVLLQAVNTLFFETAERMTMSKEEITEQMDNAYKLLPYVIFCFWGWLRRFNIYSFGASIVGLFLLISFGSRGPIACTLLFVVLYVLFYKEIKGKWIVLSLLGIGVVLASAFFEEILLFIENVLSQLGLSTRIVNMALNESAEFNGSGREEISSILIGQLHDAPFFGYGIGGTWKFVGTYAHNIFLDIFISFGLIPGAFILLVMFYVLFKGWRFCKTWEEKGFMLVLFCCFAKLFISYTLFIDASWMMMLGFCVGVMRRKQITGLYKSFANASCS